MRGMGRADLGQRLRLALDMFQTGVELHRMGLRRRHPDETEEGLAERLRSWLQDRDDHADPPQLVSRPAGR